MSIERDEVRRIASLAHLRLSDQDVGRLTHELNAILEHVDDLRSLELVDHSDLTPQVRTPLESSRSVEADEPDRLATSPELMAPQGHDGFFVVPPPPGLDHGDSS